MTNKKELNETELQKISGGEGETLCMYRLRKNDWVFDSSNKEDIVCILEDIDTNDKYNTVKCRKRRRLDISIVGKDSYNVSVNSIMDKYREYGGNLAEM